MSQLCVLNRAVLVSRCAERFKQRSLWFQREQRLHVEGPNPAAAACSKRRSRSWIWLCGLGLGVAVAVGLKTNREKANVPCGDRENLRIGGYEAAIEASRELLKRIQAEVGAPGLVVGVSVNGHQVWCEGFGYADLENRVRCGPATVMRIASISKPLTSAAAALLCEEGKLDLDAPVQKYVPEFPVKQFDGQDVTITPRLLLSHLSGIRHYEKDGRKVREKAKRPLKPPAQEKEEEKSSAESKQNSQENSAQAKKEFEQEEYYLKENFENVIQALDLFKDDPLIYKPGDEIKASAEFTVLNRLFVCRHHLSLLHSWLHSSERGDGAGLGSALPGSNDEHVLRAGDGPHGGGAERPHHLPSIQVLSRQQEGAGGELPLRGQLLQVGWRRLPVQRGRPAAVRERSSLQLPGHPTAGPQQPSARFP